MKNKAKTQQSFLARYDGGPVKFEAIAR